MTAPYLVDIERYFKDRLANLNHPLDKSIAFDTTNWQRFDCSTSSKNNKDASYRAHSDLNPVPVLKFECHKCGIKENIIYKECDTLITPFELEGIQQEAAKRKLEQEKWRNMALKAMQAEWETAKPCITHAYFERKCLSINAADGLRSDKFGNVLCPVKSINGEVITTQTIPVQGKKRFYADVSSKNGFHAFGTIESSKSIYFAEGIATAKTINESINSPVICVYGKRFNSIAPIVAEAYPDSQLIYCCDLPSGGEAVTSEENAHEAVALVGGSICLPDFSDVPATLQPEIKRSDFNDLLVLLMAAQGNGKMDALCILKEQLTIKPKRHNQILSELIKKITSVNFRQVTGIADEKKLKNSHFQIITIEQILELAKLNQWGICKNHDFVYIYNGAYWGLIDIDELKSFLGESSEMMGVDKYVARYFNFRDQLYKQFITLANLFYDLPVSV